MQKHFCRLLVHLLTPTRPPDFIYGFLFHNRETRAVPLLCNQTSLFQRGLNLKLLDNVVCGGWIILEMKMLAATV